MSRPATGKEGTARGGGGAAALGGTLRCADRMLNLGEPVVMGVLNVTPDSFSDGGSYPTPTAAAQRALRMIDEGAAIIDVGGESTRPGAAPAGFEQECARIMPVLAALEGCGAALSVDTRNPKVMERAIGAGAHMINDVGGMRKAAAVRAVARSGCAVCVMHMKGTPRSMQQLARYSDVVGEVRGFLAGRIRALADAGVGADRICVDAGFGFGKKLAHNLSLLAHLDELQKLGRPVLVGLSRKSMLGAVTGREVGGRLPAGIAAAVLALERGARIIRTHDVAATADALKMWAAVRAAAPPVAA